MRFELDQRIAAPPDAVAEAFADPALYLVLAEAPKLGRPEVLDHQRDGDVVRMRIRYAFAGELNAAARRVLDPAKLTWVEESSHDLAARDVRFTLVPDHYRDRFQCAGGYRFEPDGDGTRRRSHGELRVKAPLVARAVEGAIVSGLREHQADEVALVERFLSSG